MPGEKPPRRAARATINPSPKGLGRIEACPVCAVCMNHGRDRQTLSAKHRSGAQTGKAEQDGQKVMAAQTR